MSRLSTVITAVLASATALSAHQTPQAPVFRSSTSLVRVDVTVLDGAGKPVPGLTPDDFEITLDGRAQKVQTVDYETTSTRRAVSATSERQATTATAAPAARLVVMLVDDLSMSATRNRDLFLAASRFVASLPDSDFVGLATTSGAANVNPTRDHLAVEAGLRRAVGQSVDLRSLPPDVVVGLSEAMEIEDGNKAVFTRVVARDCFNGKEPTARDLQSQCANEVERKARLMASQARRTTDIQMASFQGVINAMRPVTGEKALVILSDGLIMPSRGQRQAVDIRAIEREAATAGVQVSVLYGEPETVTMTARTGDETQVRRDDGQALGRGIEDIAGATGGNFYRLSGQPDRFFGFVAVAMSAVYHLGVELPAGSAPGREFKLAARVKRSGVTVRANRVAMHESAAPVPVDAQFQAVLTKGELRYGVPVAVGTVVRPGNTSDNVTVGVNVEVPAGVSGPLTVVFAAVDDKGTSRTGKHVLSAQASAASYRLSFSIPLPSGSYRLRLGVADADGQVGGLDMPVAAQLNRIGTLRTSDILTAWTGAEGKPQFLSLGNLPSAATSLLMGLELAPSPETAPPSGVRVAWTVLTETGQSMGEQTIVPSVTGNRLNAQTQISVASLPAGSYELRATVFIANQAAGVTSMVFRKGDKEPCTCGLTTGDTLPWPRALEHHPDANR